MVKISPRPISERVTDADIYKCVERGKECLYTRSKRGGARHHRTSSTNTGTSTPKFIETTAFPNADIVNFDDGKILELMSDIVDPQCSH